LIVEFFQFSAATGSGPKSGFFCGGALINQNSILTGRYEGFKDLPTARMTIDFQLLIAFTLKF
jgi:hypothetical protein